MSRTDYPRLPRAVVCTAAEKPPLFAWNRYTEIIGAAIRLKGNKYLSIQWRRPR